jgi:TPP-dependent pyruvate/acetoin dehydrogenase alpha subunit
MNSLADHDPIAKLEAIISKRRVPKKEVAEIREKIDARINAAVEAGRAGNAPDFDRAQADVYTAVRGG